MFRVWGKIMKDNHLVKDTVVCIDDASLTRTKKVYKALEEMCYEFDLAKPIRLKKNQNDYILHARTRFDHDNFVEAIEFDYLDFQIIQTGQLRNQWIFLWKKADRFIRFVKRISAMILSESAGQNTKQR